VSWINRPTVCANPIGKTARLHRRLFPVVMSSAKRLPVGTIPEQNFITTMWNDVVDDSCRNDFAGALAHAA
jgi:hypothetical protein